MSHEKKRLPKATVLSKTRYVGFARARVQDDTRNNTITGLGPTHSRYPLLNGRRWIDLEKKP